MTTAILRSLTDTDQTVAHPAEDVRGRTVFDSVGEEVGRVDGLMVDDAAQDKVRFLRLKAGGFHGHGPASKHIMIPIDIITRITHDAVYIDQGHEHLASAPDYDPALVSDRDDPYWGGLYGYYGVAPYWGRGYTYPPYPYYDRR